jgi:hypothetical protein
MSVSSQTVTLPANSTSYVYLNTSTAAIQSNQSGYPSTNCYSIATVITSASGVLSCVDNRPDVTSGGGGGSSGVTSVTFTGDGTVLSSTPSAPVTSTGTLTASLNTQSANLVLAGPTSGSATAPTFRALVTADLPSGTGTVTSFSAGNLSPLFTTSVANSTTTPALSFSLSNAAAGTVLNNATSSAAGPTYTAQPVIGSVASQGSIGITAANATVVTIAVQGPGASYNFVLPNSAGASGSVLTSGGGGSTAMSWVTQANLAVAWSSLVGATGATTIANGGNGTTFNQTSSVAWTWQNTSTATSGTTNASPSFNLGSNYWTGSASALNNWLIQATLGAGTNAASLLTFTQSGSTGFAALSTNAVALQFTGTNAGIDFGTNTSSWVFEFSDSNRGNSDGQISYTTGSNLALLSGAGNQLVLSGNLTTQNASAVKIQNNSSFTGTSNQFICNILGTFAPTSGSATFIGNRITTTVNQTGSASGSYQNLVLQAVETALLGTSNLLLLAQAGSAGTTTKFSLDNSGNVILTLGTTTAVTSSPSLTLTGSYQNSGTPTYAADSWVMQDVIGAGTNGTSILTFTHSGSTGTASVQVPNLTLAGTVIKYNAIATVANGVPSEYATVNSTGRTANVGSTTLYAVPSGGAGFYRVSAYIVETTAGSVSSTLPSVVLGWLDETGTTQSATVAPGGSTANTVGTYGSGSFTVYSEASQNITYSTTGYVSSAAATMTYSVRLRLEYLG